MNTIAGLKKSPGISRSVHSDEPVAIAGKKILAAQYDLFLERESGTRSGEDIEDLHKMRVASRRMRSLLKLMSDIYVRDRIKPFEDDLKHVAETLGKVRDIDTFVSFLRTCLPELPKSVKPAVEHISEDRLQSREKELDTLRNRLDQDWYTQFKDQFSTFLEVHTQDDHNSPIVHFAAPRIIEKALRKILRKRDEVYDFSEEQLHRLRIKFKRLRYICEFFASCYNQDMQEFVDLLILNQEHLGKIHDHFRDIQFLQISRDEMIAQMKHENGSASLDKLIRHFQKSIQKRKKLFFETWRRFSLLENEYRYLYIIRNAIQ